MADQSDTAGKWIRPDELPPVDVARLKKHAEVVMGFVLPRTVGLQLKDGKFPFGSGTLFASGAFGFIATASHVLERVEKVGVENVDALFHTGEGDEARAIRLPLLKPEFARRAYMQGEADIGAIRFSPELVKQVPGVAAVNLSDVKDLVVPKDGRQSVVFSGYPGALGHEENQATALIKETFTKICSAEAHKDDGSWKRPPDADIHLDWSAQFPVEQKMATPPVLRPPFEPDGMSGGGLWHMRIKNKETDPTGVPEFVGIVWFHFAKASCVRAIPSVEWIALLNERRFLPAK